MSNRRRNPLLPIALLLLPGCGLTHPYPSKSLFVLPPMDLAKTVEPRPIPLEIPRAAVSPPYNARSFQYRVSETLVEPAYYAQWSADPGSLLSASVSRSLASTGAFIALPEGAGDNAPILLLSVTELYADVRNEDSPRAVVAIQATLRDRSGQVLMVRDARSETPAVSRAPSDMVDAWATGAAEITERLIPDLRAAAEAFEQSTEP